jgi:acetyl-CoA carboxylase biotin carboxylase subunit
MRLMGDKNKARQAMKRAKLPVIPGSDQIIDDLNEANKTAEKIGYPVILKAAAGGGGKGLRIVRSPAKMEEQFAIAQGEAKAAFGNSALYLEKYFQSARHIEIQVVGDKKGKVIAFAERECSIQRKHQKLVEETPSPFVDERFRKKIIKAVEEAAHSIGYQSLGTFEFLVDEKKRFYFMEANTRVQVEHPVTEMIYGIDLIREQINLAAGKNLSFSHDLDMDGHSLECRINAEDAKTFLPSPGKIDFLVFPGGPGVRVDTSAYCGWNIPPDYDSMIAKVATVAPNRMEAIAKMRTALEMTTVVGIKTNIPLHLELLSNSEFLKGDYDIQFMERYLAKDQNQNPKN